MGTLQSESTLEHRKLQKLSPSRAKLFVQCPKRFYYETILELSAPSTIPTAKGTLAHHAFERVFDHPRSERDHDTAISYVRPAWDVMTDPLRSITETSSESPEWRIRKSNGLYREAVEENSIQEMKLLNSANEYINLFPQQPTHLLEEFLKETESLVSSWFKMETPSKFDPLERELYLLSEISGMQVHGYIDRLDLTKSKEGKNLYWISDYKTGKPPHQKYQDDAFFQLEVYALLVREHYGETPHMLRLIYVREGHPDYVLKRKVTKELLEKTRVKVKSIINGINKSYKNNNWLPKPQVLCGWCPFKPVCPAHNEENANLTVLEIASLTGTTKYN
ncbi:MAG: RecB family exonuclease [Candidatus Paceibacterota bacterium]